MINKFLKSALSLLAVTLLSINSWGQAPANNNNPYDYVGKIHNQIVEEFSSKHTGKGLSTEEIFAITYEIAKNNQEAKSRGLKIEKADHMVLNNVIRDFNNDLKNIVREINISDKGKTKAQTLINYFITIGTKPTKPTYSEIHSYVVQFENEVINDTALSEKDKMVILCGTSTARYSSKLWIDKAEAKQITANGRKWWGHVIVIGADVVGGLIGGGKENPSQAVSTGASLSNGADEYLDNQGK